MGRQRGVRDALRAAGGGRAAGLRGVPRGRAAGDLRRPLPRGRELRAAGRAAARRGGRGGRGVRAGLGELRGGDQRAGGVGARRGRGGGRGRVDLGIGADSAVREGGRRAGRESGRRAGQHGEVDDVRRAERRAFTPHLSRHRRSRHSADSRRRLVDRQAGFLFRPPSHR